MSRTPGEQALELAQSAVVDFRRGHLKSARTKLRDACAMKHDVERCTHSWTQNHRAYTEALLAMAALCYKLGNMQLGNTIAKRAQAWADDPNCSSNRHVARSLDVRNRKLRHYLSGLPVRVRYAILPRGH